MYICICIYIYIYIYTCLYTCLYVYSSLIDPARKWSLGHVPWFLACLPEGLHFRSPICHGDRCTGNEASTLEVLASHAPLALDCLTPFLESSIN